VTLPAGSVLCDGEKSRLNPSAPMHLCRDCARRLTPPAHVWQKYMAKVPAKHDGEKWVCEKRIAA
jgi:hypothetical protein